MIGSTPPDPIAVLDRIVAYSAYFRAGTGPRPGDGWQPTETLREPAVVARLATTAAERMGTAESRVAASSVFVGYAARLWSVTLGSLTVAGRPIRLDADHVLWRSHIGLELHIDAPRFGDDPIVEVLDRQIEPLIQAWRRRAAPGLLWGNTASALVGAGRVIGRAADPFVQEALADARLATTFDPRTGRRRSCCLYYRVPGGGVCGDCVFTDPPRPVKEKS